MLANYSGSFIFLTSSLTIFSLSVLNRTFRSYKAYIVISNKRIFVYSFFLYLPLEIFVKLILNACDVHLFRKYSDVDQGIRNLRHYLPH